MKFPHPYGSSALVALVLSISSFAGAPAAPVKIYMKNADGTLINRGNLSAIHINAKTPSDLILTFSDRFTVEVEFHTSEEAQLINNLILRGNLSLHFNERGIYRTAEEASTPSIRAEQVQIRLAGNSASLQLSAFSQAMTRSNGTL